MAGAGLGDRVHDQLSGYVLDRLLPRRIDLRDRDGIRLGERRAELLRQMPRPRVQVRLEQDEDAAGGRLTGATSSALRSCSPGFRTERKFASPSAMPDPPIPSETRK